jgi:hypothetical protein
MAREATPEEAAAFHKASGVDPRLENALGIDTKTPVREPSGVPVPVNGGAREATPEEEAAFHASSGKPADFSDVTSGGGSTENGSGITHVFGDRAVHPAKDAAPPGLMQTIGHNLQQGITFGQQNRLDALLSPGDYSANLAKNEAASAAENKESPVLAGVSNFVGGLASPANPVIGKALSVAAKPVMWAGGKVAPAIFKRFPQLADRLAMRMGNIPSGQAEERIAQNFKYPENAGKYANDFIDQGLLRLTPEATGAAAGASERAAGETLRDLRAGRSVPVEDVRSFITKMGAGSGVQVPPEAAQELQMFASKLPPAGSVSLDELATLTQQHVNAPMQRLAGIGSQASPEAGRVLQAAKTGLEQMQGNAIGEAGQAAYKPAQKAYAIANDVREGTSSAVNTPAKSVGQAMLGGGSRVKAYATLRAYQAAKSPVTKAMANAAAKAGPAAASTLSQAQASDNPVQQGAALMQAQANDSSVRKPSED